MDAPTNKIVPTPEPGTRDQPEGQSAPGHQWWRPVFLLALVIAILLLARLAKRRLQAREPDRETRRPPSISGGPRS
jgi:hypothetical protein